MTKERQDHRVLGHDDSGSDKLCHRRCHEPDADGAGRGDVAAPRLTAAAISRAAVGDSAGDIIAPLGFLGLVLASWALRPADRKLAATAAPEQSPVRV
jgi:hypothetical protein